MIDSVRKFLDIKDERLDQILIRLLLHNPKFRCYHPKCALLRIFIQSSTFEKCGQQNEQQFENAMGMESCQVEKVQMAISITEFSIWLVQTSEAIIYVVGPEYEKDKKKKYVYTTSQPEYNVLCENTAKKIDTKTKNLKKLSNVGTE